MPPIRSRGQLEKIERQRNRKRSLLIGRMPSPPLSASQRQLMGYDEKDARRTASEISKMEDNENMRKVQLNTGEIELPKIDVSKYVGAKTVIERVGEYEGTYGFFVKVESEVLDTIEGGKEKIELRASRVFGLQEDTSGNIGWGKDTNLGTYLAKMGVKHYKELVGKPIVVQTQTSKKDKKDYLTFN